MKTDGLITASAEGKQMTLAELAEFIGECKLSGVPDHATPQVGTSWKGGIARIAVTRPLQRT